MRTWGLPDPQAERTSAGRSQTPCCRTERAVWRGYATNDPCVPAGMTRGNGWTETHARHLLQCKHVRAGSTTVIDLELTSVHNNPQILQIDRFSCLVVPLENWELGLLKRRWPRNPNAGDTPSRKLHNNLVRVNLHDKLHAWHGLLYKCFFFFHKFPPLNYVQKGMSPKLSSVISWLYCGESSVHNSWQTKHKRASKFHTTTKLWKWFMRVSCKFPDRVSWAWHSLWNDYDHVCRSLLLMILRWLQTMNRIHVVSLLVYTGQNQPLNCKGQWRSQGWGGRERLLPLTSVGNECKLVH